MQPLPSRANIKDLLTLADDLEHTWDKTKDYDKIFIRQVADERFNLSSRICFEKKSWFSKLLIFFHIGGREKNQYDLEKIRKTFSTAFQDIDNKGLDKNERVKLANFQDHLNQIFQHKPQSSKPLEHDFQSIYQMPSLSSISKLKKDNGLTFKVRGIGEDLLQLSYHSAEYDSRKGIQYPDRFSLCVPSLVSSQVTVYKKNSRGDFKKVECTFESGYQVYFQRWNAIPDTTYMLKISVPNQREQEYFFKT